VKAEKYCRSCDTIKDIDLFGKDKHKKSGRVSKCKDCAYIYQKEYREKNRELCNKKARDWRSKNNEKNRENVRNLRKSKYNSIAEKYRILKTTSKARNLECIITLEQYSAIIEHRTCYYCDQDFKNEGGTNLNRIDNNIGYTVDNVKPCCKICNRIMNKFTREELLARLKKISERI